MKRIDYTYVPLRYVHDPMSGEALNVGVLLCAPQAGYVKCRVDRHVRRFTETFGGFSVSLHRRALRELEKGVARVSAQYRNGQGNLFASLGNAEAVARSIWPDPGTQYVAGPLMYGSISPLDRALESLFDRLVLRQQPSRHEQRGREDNDVWNDVAPALRSRQLLTKLAEQTVPTQDGPLKFEHTYRNGALHVVQPLSFDLLAEDSLLKKAHTWFGRGDTMSRTEVFGKLLFVLGRPRRGDLLEEYDRCRRILERIPLRPELYEEQDAESFAARVSALTADHPA